jgi:hypothetical protein
MRIVPLLLAVVLVLTTVPVLANDVNRDDASSELRRAHEEGAIAEVPAWPVIARYQNRGLVIISNCEPDCELHNDWPDVGGGACQACYNPCMKNKVCSITATACTNTTDPYGRCKNQSSNPSQPCVAC